MITLITLLISLLGYGTQTDFSHLTEDELNHKIEMAEQNADGGTTTEWDMSLTSE